MTITREVQDEFLDEESKSLICLPCRTSARSIAETASAAASANAHRLRVGAIQQPTIFPAISETQAVMSTVPLQPQAHNSIGHQQSPSTKGQRWSEDEHERFLLGLDLFPAGPWKKIARVVGTRDSRQTMSHAQKYRQKIKRRKLGQRTPPGAHSPPSATQRWQHSAVSEVLLPTTSVGASGGEASTRTHLSVTVSGPAAPSRQPMHTYHRHLDAPTGARQPSALTAGPSAARTLSGPMASALASSAHDAVDDTTLRLELELRQTPDVEPPLLAPPDNWSPLPLLNVWTLPSDET